MVVGGTVTVEILQAGVQQASVALALAAWGSDVPPHVLRDAGKMLALALAIGVTAGVTGWYIGKAAIALIPHDRRPPISFERWPR